MATVAQRLQNPPATDRGALIGAGDWKLTVEALLPADPDSLWGVATWDEDEWTDLAWVDVTPYVRGMEWTRGADEYLGRPRIGEATITLDNSDGRWSPWTQAPPAGGPAYFAPGTVMRAGIRSATDTRGSGDIATGKGWVPQWCMITDSWSETYAGVGADRFVDVTAVETLRDLSSIDDNAVSSVGAGERTRDRYTRLLEASEWKYGSVYDSGAIGGSGGNELQATTMAGNRLAELYLVADSSDTRFRTSRKGEALVESQLEYANANADSDVWPLVDFSFGAGPGGVDIPFINFAWYPDDTTDTIVVPYDADSFLAVSEDSHIINDARLTRAGSTSQQVFEQSVSIGRYGRRSYVRGDLLNVSDVAVAVIAEYITERKGLNTLRVREFTIAASDRGDEYYLATLAADIGVGCLAVPPTYASGTDGYVQGFIERLTHRVTPRHGGAVTWQTVVGVATRTVYNVPGAQLPAE